MSDTHKVSIKFEASSNISYGWEDSYDTGETLEDWQAMSVEDREKILNEIAEQEIENDVSWSFTDSAFPDET